MADTEIRFVLSGQPLGGSRGGAPAQSRTVQGSIKTAVTLSAQREGGDTVHGLAVAGEDVVVLHLAGGPSLVLHPETARDLLRGQGGDKRGVAPDGGSVVVPVQLRWRGLEQAAPTRGAGFLGEVLLSGFEIVTGLRKDSAADFVAGRLVAAVDGGVEAGVYALRPDALPALKSGGQRCGTVPAAGDAPLLVLLHGTFVDTASTFGKLWTQHPQAVRALFQAYGDRVYALDHPTLGASPFANALTLVQALPRGARLHLLTHSRGGLVAEVLARLATQHEIGSADLAPFAGEAHAMQRAELLALAQAVREREIHVDRIVRVACPARGTLLASQRLDAYLSVLQWGLQLAGVPVAPALLDFLTEVARRRADPRLLPGLAAMLPGSALVQWLNAGDLTVAGDLRVVAGDLQGDSIGSWLKTLLADAYYWADNDIVVQTRSMYGGAPRAGGASFLLDQGGKVTHFNYFANGNTVDAVVAGLTQAQPAGFRSIGPLSWAGEDGGGRRAPRRSAAGPDTQRPAVFVLPGLPGSHLQAGGQRIWLGPRLLGGLDRLQYTGAPDDVEPDGVIGAVYGGLIAHLGQTHEAIGFAFDWRRPIEEEARRLADALSAALDARQSSGQPVRMVAHGMGGLLARAVQLERPAVWDRLMAHDGARLLMLGTPNGGCWTPMQVLSGDDSFGNTLAASGAPLRDRRARQLLAAMPGLLQLQDGLLDQGLDRSDTWRRLADEDLRQARENSWWHGGAPGDGDPLAAYAWGLPSQAVLDQARALRERLDAQRDAALPQCADKLLLVVGHARLTPAGFDWGGTSPAYLDAIDGGDGRVPLASALLPGVRTWQLDCDHGSLPATTAAFAAFDELLTQGDTTRLGRLRQRTRSGDMHAVQHQRSRPSRQAVDAAPPDSERAVFALPQDRADDGADASARTALRVRVLNGNLAFIGMPLLVGHYRSRTLTGTEQVLDRRVGGAMSTSLQIGIYPEQLGTVQVFSHRQQGDDDPWRAAPQQHVVVVGLGDEGGLRERDLVQGVRQGTIAWAGQLVQGVEGGADAQFELAATLIGSGGSGVQVGSAARAIAQGVLEANESLAASGWPVVARLTLVELYLDRATDAWRGLQVLAASNPGRLEVEPTVRFGTGPLRRPVADGYRGTDYDLITATSPSEGTIAFTLDSKRARTELRAQVTQARLVRELVQRASNADNQDTQIGRTLFQMLIAPEVEPLLGGTGRMLLELDAGTAPIPWELLDTAGDGRSGDRRPWAIRCQLLRKLRTADFREQVQDANADDRVLVIGEPLVDPQRYGPLPGALAEAKAVAQQLGGAAGVGSGQLTVLVEHQDAGTIVNALFARRYRILHVAGHGEAGAQGGVVMSGGTFLGPAEVAAMRTVPELVFINCCHGAARDAAQTLHSLDHSAFAAGIAQALVAIGVRCVIAAGWAVQDAPASLFATTFYGQLGAGANFITAVAAAREAAWRSGGNTWAAYQCYGDPDWRLRRSVGDAAAPPPVLADDLTGIASPLDLTLVLEELIAQSRWQGAPAARQRDRIRRLEARFADAWGSMGAIAEAFALAHAESDSPADAIAWYRRAQRCNDASASMQVHEQLGNLLAREAWAAVRDGAAGAFAAAHAQLAEATQLLEVIAALAPTVERLGLLGSAWKRRAMLERRRVDRAAEQAALKKCAAAYSEAEQRARSNGDTALHYPLMNSLVVDLVLALTAGTAAQRHVAQERLDAARGIVDALVANDPGFWSVVATVEIALYRAVLRHDLAASRMALEAAFRDVQARAPAPRRWASVAEQAEFVLEGDPGKHGDAAERHAAQALLRLLRQFAGMATAEIEAAPAASANEVLVIADGVAPGPVEALCARLRRHGMQAWADTRLGMGGTLPVSLAHAIQRARACVVVVGAGASGRSWDLVFEHALDHRDLALVVLAVGATKPPPFLHGRPTVALPGTAKGLARAADRVASLLVAGGAR